MGLEEEEDLVYIIDFGLSRQYINPKTREHIPLRQGKSIIGTANFVSINTHAGVEQSRRDDLESISYLLVFLARGSLPWQDIKAKEEDMQYTNMMNAKKTVSSKELCEGLPTEFETFVKYCRELKFEDQPNYVYVKKLFKIAMSTRKMACDNRFDWLPENDELIKGINSNADSYEDSAGNGLGEKCRREVEGGISR